MTKYIELPRKYKKQIIKFCKEYEAIASPHYLYTKATVSVIVSWSSDDTADVFLNEEEEIKLGSIQRKADKRIQAFIKKIERFGRRLFNDKDWLWEMVLWNYDPELGDSYRDLNIKYV